MSSAPNDQGVWTIVVAGGSGRRFGSAKQFEALDDSGVRVVDLAVSRSMGQVVLVVPAAEVAEAVAEFSAGPGEVRVVAGGSSRTASVRAGLDAVPAGAEVICVHDAARPFASTRLYAAVIEAVRAGAVGAVPALAVTDTIKLIDASGVVVETPERDRLVAVQTPQAFEAEVLRAAHARAFAAGHEGTDDASLIEWMVARGEGEGRIVVVAGESGNRKVTHRDDLEWARAEWARRRGEAEQ